MADVIINDIYLSAIADAIRTKLGTESTYTPPNMAPAGGRYLSFLLQIRRRSYRRNQLKRSELPE